MAGQPKLDFTLTLAGKYGGARVIQTWGRRCGPLPVDCETMGQTFESRFPHLQYESSTNSCFIFGLLKDFYQTMPMGVFSTEPNSNKCPITVSSSQR